MATKKKAAKAKGKDDLKWMEEQAISMGAKRIWIWQHPQARWGFGWDKKEHAMECVSDGQLYTGILYPVPTKKKAVK